MKAVLPHMRWAKTSCLLYNLRAINVCDAILYELIRRLRILNRIMQWRRGRWCRYECRSLREYWRWARTQQGRWSWNWGSHNYDTQLEYFRLWSFIFMSENSLFLDSPYIRKGENRAISNKIIPATHTHTYIYIFRIEPPIVVLRRLQVGSTRASAVRQQAACSATSGLTWGATLLTILV